MHLIPLTLALLLVMPTASAAQALPENAQCDAVQVPEGHQLLGRVLREAPDLPAELQRINLMSNVSDCFNYSYAKLAAYIQAHPEEHRASFVAARFIWRVGQKDEAIAMLEPVVAEHPDFASGLVLLGAMYVDRDIDKALQYLESARRLSPDDLWMTVNLLKAQASKDLSVDARRQLLELANSPNAPSFVRSSSADFLKNTSPVDGPEYEALVRGKIAHATGAFREAALMDLAGVLMRTGRHAEARRALAEITPPKYMEDKVVRALLAESLLREAADIAPGITPANRDLVQQARNAVEGDFTTLALAIAPYQQLNRKLAPFIRTGQPLNIDQRDSIGDTLLCKTVRSGDVQAVRDAISDGADVNARCLEKTALGWSIDGSGLDTLSRRDIVVALLEAGADLDTATDKPGGLESNCRSRAWCEKDLLPILEAHRARTGR